MVALFSIHLTKSFLSSLNVFKDNERISSGKVDIHMYFDNAARTFKLKVIDSGCGMTVEGYIPFSLFLWNFSTNLSDIIFYVIILHYAVCVSYSVMSLIIATRLLTLVLYFFKFCPNRA